MVVEEMAPMSHWAKLPHVLNLSNGIIGVSILAMPFCMKQCGLIFGALVLFGSSLLTRLSCDLLIKGAYFARANSYESFAMKAYGRPGKTAAEICLILYSKGTLIAFFVIIGDLGPSIFSNLIGTSAGVKTSEPDGTMRILFMAAIAFLVILPLSMLKTMGSLSRISSLAILFYGFLMTRIIVQSLPALFATDWWRQVIWWQPSGFFQTLPIFALSLSCQTQLFVMASEIPDCSPAKMDDIVRSGLNLCSSIYLMVGAFGYIAFHQQPIGGDVLVLLGSDGVTKFIKVGFLLSLAVSYPIMIFPCRAAIYSMLFERNVASLIGSDVGNDRMQPIALKVITVYLVAFNLLIAVWVPDVELILALCGSLVGSLVCFILPGLLFIRVCPSQQVFLRFLAKLCVAIGLFSLIFSTYVSLRSTDTPSGHAIVESKQDLRAIRGAREVDASLRFQPAKDEQLPGGVGNGAQPLIKPNNVQSANGVEQHVAKRQIDAKAQYAEQPAANKAPPAQQLVSEKLDRVVVTDLLSNLTSNSNSIAQGGSSGNVAREI